MAVYVGMGPGGKSKSNVQTISERVMVLASGYRGLAACDLFFWPALKVEI